MTFVEIPIIARSFIAYFMLIMLWITTAESVWFAMAKKLRYLFVSIPVIIADYFIMQSITSIERIYNTKLTEDFVNRFSLMPAILIIAICLILTALTVSLGACIFSGRRKNLSLMSIKTGVDTLITGICCYEDNGRILLKNKKMDEICHILFGKTYFSGNKLFSDISEGEFLSGKIIEKTDTEVIVQLTNNEIRSFRKETITAEDNQINEIFAVDVTNEYLKMQELSAKKEKLQELNLKLEKYNREIVSLSISEEILNAKIKIHDELGAALLAGKKFLLSGGDKDDESHIKQLFSKNIELLGNEADDGTTSELEKIKEISDDVGIELVISGKIPESEAVKDIMITAIHECLTNAIRHAHADKLFVEIFENENFYYISLSNNGEKPKCEIEEKGGLVSLRSRTGKYGGEMTIESLPEFKLRLTLPKEDENAI